MIFDSKSLIDDRARLHTISPCFLWPLLDASYVESGDVLHVNARHNGHDQPGQPPARLE